MNIQIQEPTHTIEYFVKGWETDNNKEGTTNKYNYNTIAKDLTNYINMLTPTTHHKTTHQVKQELTNYYN